uniref:Protein kinase domain-containing protein n=1 Tax=Spongospora subterranea TaxID=70186 RepID=A0A0H5QXW6_9EUKA|eukprot:CRZ06486.1 hypothetical protein [Spongospora subterranea]
MSAFIIFHSSNLQEHKLRMRRRSENSADLLFLTSVSGIPLSEFAFDILYKRVVDKLRPRRSKGDLFKLGPFVKQASIEAINYSQQIPGNIDVYRAVLLSEYGIVHDRVFREHDLYSMMDMKHDVPALIDDLLTKVDHPVVEDLSHIDIGALFDHSNDESRWILAVNLVKYFDISVFGKPEIQYHARLWDPLLRACMCAFLPSNIACELEFPLHKALVDYPVQHYIDLVFRARGQDTKAHSIPFLFVEISAHQVETGDHKDFRKMATDMASAMIALFGVTRDLPLQEKAKLRVYGLYIGGTQFVPCVIVPLIQSEGVSMIFYSNREWTYNLAMGSSPSNNITDEAAPEIDIDVSDIFALADTMDIRAANKAAIAAAKRAHSISFQHVSYQDIEESLTPLWQFCKTVRQYAFETHSNILTSGGDNDMFSYPKTFRNPPSSRPTHSSRTPQKDPSNRPRKLPRVSGPSDSERTSLINMKLPDGASVVVKQKPKSTLQEARLLLLAQGPGIVVLHDWHELQPRGVVLTEEMLADVLVEGLSVKELGLLAIRLMVDGLGALDTLSRADVVHRDISPNNLLYSLSAQAWRLTDFDCASSGPGIAHRVFGTDGYIAPESLTSLSYSRESDIWSFGMTARFYLFQIEDVYSNMSEYDSDLGDLLALLQGATCFLMSERPGDRHLPQSLRQLLSTRHSEWNIAVHNIDNRVIEPRDFSSDIPVISGEA